MPVTAARRAPVTAAVLDRIQSVLHPFAVFCRESIEQAPATGGAYLLLLHLEHEVRFSRRHTTHLFMPGWYVYAGNAHGPGGMRARLRRHCNPDKPVHWHIDELTIIADAIHAIPVEYGQECQIVAALGRTPWFRPAGKGFGSTDCRVCPSHLLEYSTCRVLPPAGRG